MSASHRSTSRRSTYDAAAAAALQWNLRLDSPQPMPGGDPPRDDKGWGGFSNTEPENPDPNRGGRATFLLEAAVQS